jgi:phosphoribosylformylglycinamidine synthase
MKPILLSGSAAFSPFRLDALRSAMAARSAKLKTAEIETRWVYAIQSEKGVSAETLERAAMLLNADLNGKAEISSTSSFYVTPRKGTISPWSSRRRIFSAIAD